jgi:hypothetical protein
MFDTGSVGVIPHATALSTPQMESSRFDNQAATQREFFA